MSFPPQRFFSLSSSSRPSTSATPATSAPSSANPNNNIISDVASQHQFLQPNPIDLLVRACGTGDANSKTNGELLDNNELHKGHNMSQDGAALDTNGTDNNNNGHSSNNAPSSTPSTKISSNNHDSSNLQHAFFQSMATQNAQGAQQPGAIFGATLSPGNTHQGNSSAMMGWNLNAVAAAGGSSSADQPFGQLLGNMSAQTTGGAINSVAAPRFHVGAPTGSQGQSQPHQAGGAQGNMISQLVASLQAQQHAQQQVQVQAALVRAFGPGANTLGASMASLGGLGPVGVGGAAAGASVYGAGLGVQGLHSKAAAVVQDAAASTQGSAASDLLSRMQLVSVD